MMGAYLLTLKWPFWVHHAHVSLCLTTFRFMDTGEMAPVLSVGVSLIEYWSSVVEAVIVMDDTLLATAAAVNVRPESGSDV